jgi:hypothetical protein
MGNPIETKTLMSLVEAANSIDEAASDGKKYTSLEKAVVGRVSRVGTSMSYARSGNTITAYFNHKVDGSPGRLTAIYIPRASQWSVYAPIPNFDRPTPASRVGVGKKMREFGHHIIDLSRAVEDVEAMLKDTKPDEWED